MRLRNHFGFRRLIRAVLNRSRSLFLFFRSMVILLRSSLLSDFLEAEWLLLLISLLYFALC
jgi:hypothetical protein